MENAVTTGLKSDDVEFLILTALVAAAATLAVFIACFCWFRREQRRMQKRILNAIANPGHESDELFLTGRNAAAYGELVAQFKVNQGKQVVSLLEADGKRFIHVDGELSSRERARMVRYLKSEGFMS
jgi:hypothetical protein